MQPCSPAPNVTDRFRRHPILGGYGLASNLTSSLQWLAVSRHRSHEKDLDGIFVGELLTLGAGRLEFLPQLLL